MPLEDENGGGGSPSPDPVITIEDGNLLQGTGDPAIYAYWAGRKHWIVSMDALQDAFGPDALAYVKPVFPHIIALMPSGRDITSAGVWAEIRGGQWNDAPPPPAVCTPVPPEQPNAERIEVTSFMAALAVEPEGEIRDGMLEAVCEGFTALLRNGILIGCKEQWPAVVRSYCFEYVEETIPVFSEEGEDEDRVINIQLDSRWALLQNELLHGPRALNKHLSDTADFLEDIRKGG